nr:hypothetical protein [Tanacetum cinerariifolium]
MDVEIEQDDLNQKFLTSLAPEWLMHTIVWRNRSDLDTMSLDDLYNRLKVYESEVQKKSKPNSQNLAFISSAKHSSGNEEVNTASVSIASTNVLTASANIGVVSISQDTACAYIASQSSGSQIKFKDINQIDEDDMEEIDIKWNMALLRMRADRFWKKTGKKISIQGTNVVGFDKSKVECFNCHKMGHFAPKALMAIDGVGWDWSYMANDEENHALIADEETLTEFALMAKTNAESKNIIYHYKLALAQVESRLAEHKSRELKYCKKITVLEFNTESRENCIESLTKDLELHKKEKENFSLLTRKFPTGSTKFSTADMGKKGNAVKASTCWIWKPSQNTTNKVNIYYLSDYEPFDGGYVSFGQGGCKITGKGTIKTGKLEFENVYFVKDLNKPQDNCSSDVLESSGNSNPTTTSTNPSADHMERLTVETSIPTVSSPVPTTYFTDSHEPSNESNEVEADVIKMKTTITASPTPTLRIYKDHPKSQIIGPVYTLIQTRNKSKKTLFIRRQGGDFILLQVFVDDIIFGSSNPHLCREFEAFMHEKFQMSAMGELKFFLGLSSNTPMDKENPWGKDRTGKDVDLHLYRSMIGSLMYLIASRSDIMFAVCACARLLALKSQTR